MHFLRHAEHMFLLDCPACGQRELRSSRALASFTTTAHGIEIVIGCTRCGAEVHLVTGACAAAPGRRTPQAPAPADAAA